jgi:hypothetical protein
MTSSEILKTIDILIAEYEKNSYHSSKEGELYYSGVIQGLKSAQLYILRLDQADDPYKQCGLTIDVPIYFKQPHYCDKTIGGIKNDKN